MIFSNLYFSYIRDHEATLPGGNKLHGKELAYQYVNRYFHKHSRVSKKGFKLCSIGLQWSVHKAMFNKGIIYVTNISIRFHIVFVILTNTAFKKNALSVISFTYHKK